MPSQAPASLGLLVPVGQSVVRARSAAQGRRDNLISLTPVTAPARLSNYRKRPW
jgi:hypothetical protein